MLVVPLCVPQLLLGCKSLLRESCLQGLLGLDRGNELLVPLLESGGLQGGLQSIFADLAELLLEAYKLLF